MVSIKYLNVKDGLISNQVLCGGQNRKVLFGLALKKPYNNQTVKSINYAPKKIMDCKAIM